MQEVENVQNFESPDELIQAMKDFLPISGTSLYEAPEVRPVCDITDTFHSLNSLFLYVVCCFLLSFFKSSPQLNCSTLVMLL